MRACSAGLCAGAQVFLLGAGAAIPLCGNSAWIAAAASVPAAAMAAAMARRRLSRGIASASSIASCFLLAASCFLCAAFACASLVVLGEQSLLPQARAIVIAVMTALFVTLCAAGGKGNTRLCFLLRGALPALLLLSAAVTMPMRDLSGVFPLLGRGGGRLLAAAAIMIAGAAPLAMLILPPEELRETDSAYAALPGAGFFAWRAAAGAACGCALLFILCAGNTPEALAGESVWGSRLLMIAGASAHQGIFDTLSILLITAASALYASQMILCCQSAILRAFPRSAKGRAALLIPAALLTAVLISLSALRFDYAFLFPFTAAPITLIALIGGRKNNKPACCRRHHRQTAVNLDALRSRPIPGGKIYITKGRTADMKKILLFAWMMLALLLLCGCGGQEIESGLFVLSLAVDPAPDGNLTVTVKALSGTKEANAAESSSGPSGSAASAQGGESPDAGLEAPEPGYIVLSATAKSCLRALSLLSATTPRTVNLSQLREIVLSQALAESGAALSILREIHAMYRANGEAVVVVTPDDAGDFIRRQRAILGVRLSQYLEVLFDHFGQMDTIPPRARLAEVISDMESGTADALAVYAAGNTFKNTLTLPGAADTDRLPGHLPRTAPAENEYLGSALFSGGQMTGVLTGEETGLLCLMMGEARRRIAFIGDAQYKTNLPTRVTRTIDRETGALTVIIRMNLTHIAGNENAMASSIAADIEQRCVSVLRKLQSAGCDAAGFGRIAVRSAMDEDAWRSMDWQTRYKTAPVRASARVKVL